MSRKTAREEAFKIIFESAFHQGDVDAALRRIESLRGASDPDFLYVQDVVRGVFARLDEIDEKISANAKGWRIERISRVSLALMRLCIYEMLYRDDIPVSVSISEALTLVETYEGPEAKPFVNGILGAVDRQTSDSAQKG